MDVTAPPGCCPFSFRHKTSIKAIASSMAGIVQHVRLEVIAFHHNAFWGSTTSANTIYLSRVQSACMTVVQALIYCDARCAMITGSESLCEHVVKEACMPRLPPVARHQVRGLSS